MSKQLVKILLIDPDPNGDRWLQELLSKITSIKFDVQCAINDAEGLESIGQNQHDIYFINQKIGDVWGGVEFVKKARISGCEQPIFFLIDSEKDYLKIESIKEIEAAGATDYFQKNKIDADAIAHSIRYALKEQEMNQALLLSQERYALALSACEVGVWDWNLITNELYVAPNLKAMLGYGHDEINPNWQAWQKVLHPGDRERVQAILDNHLAGLTSHYEVEYRRLHKDGTSRWFLSRGSTLRDINGQPCRIVVSETDITERKQLEAYLRQSLEKEKEINQLKSQFLTMVSHEFRTPLATILSSADLLEFYVEKSEYQKVLNHIKRLQSSAEYMTQMLNDVLVMEKAKNGRLMFNPTWIDLKDFCKDCVKYLEHSIQKRNRLSAKDNQKNKIVIIAKESSINEIHGFFDKELIKEMLRHLLWNAVIYSDNEESIIFEIEPINNQEIILKVKDYGLGIPTEEQTKIFDMFYRGNNIQNIPGSGLGLAIVKTCVYLHGGEISVQSKIGAGSTFTVKLPWNKSQENHQEYGGNLTNVEIMNKQLNITKIEN